MGARSGKQEAWPYNQEIVLAVPISVSERLSRLAASFCERGQGLAEDTDRARRSSRLNLDIVPGFALNDPLAAQLFQAGFIKAQQFFEDLVGMLSELRRR